MNAVRWILDIGVVIAVCIVAMGTFLPGQFVSYRKRLSNAICSTLFRIGRLNGALPWLRLGLCVPVCTMLLYFTAVVQAPIAHAYYCGDGTKNKGSHCYAQFEWYSAYHGSYTAIQTPGSGGLQCPPAYCGNNQGFIDDEMWLSDGNSNGCQQPQGGPCWVEAGYITRSTSSNTAMWYFWADNTQWGNFYLHYVNTIPSGDYNYYNGYTIVALGNGTWEVQIAAHTATYTGYSTSNPMSPDSITIGQELAGYDASAQYVRFDDNEYVDTSGYYHYQSSAAAACNGSNFLCDNPPYAQWNVLPQYSSTGGELMTYCC